MTAYLLLDGRENHTVQLHTAQVNFKAVVGNFVRQRRATNLDFAHSLSLVYCQKLKLGNQYHMNIIHVQ